MDKPNKAILTIHRDRLDDDCSKQPRLMYEWGLNLAEAKAKTERAKSKMKALAARLELDIRKDPAKYGFTKVSEDTVKAILLSMDEYQDAVAEHQQAEYEQNIIDAFVWALVDRKAELENIIRLHGQMYFSKPVVERPDGEQMARRLTEEGRKRDKS